MNESEMQVESIYVRRDTLEAILNIAQDGEQPSVQYSKDPAIFAQRAAALSMKKCGQVAEIIKAVLLNKPVKLPPADTADGEPI